MRRAKFFMLLMGLMGSVISFGQSNGTIFPFSDPEKFNAYFDGLDVEKIYFRRTVDGPIEHDWVYNGKLSPRLATPAFFERLKAGIEFKMEAQFVVSEDWRFDWIQVRFMGDSWRTYSKGLKDYGWLWESGHQLGGYMISCDANGLFLSSGKAITYIPYTQIRNVRRGTAHQSGNSDDLGIFLIGAFFHNTSGLSAGKVHRSNGDSTGYNFEEWVSNRANFQVSKYKVADYPLMMVRVGRRQFEVDVVGDKNMEIDSLEVLCNKMMLGMVTHRYEVIKTNENGEPYTQRTSVLNKFFGKNEVIATADRVGIPTLVLEEDEPKVKSVDSSVTVGATAAEPKIEKVAEVKIASPVVYTAKEKPATMPSSNPETTAAPKETSNIKSDGVAAVKPLFDQRRNMKIDWAYQGFDPSSVDIKLMKKLFYIKKNVLTTEALGLLTNRNDAQFFAMMLITNNGLILNSLVKFTPEQALLLEKLIPLYAEDATAESTLNAGEMSDVDIKNFELLYKKLSH
jgi:hypothetical protein